MLKFAATLSALSVLASVTQPALAQQIEGAIQFGLGTSLLEYSSATVKAETPIIGNQSIDVAQTLWGVSKESGVQLEGGYALTNSLVLGGLVALGGSTTTSQAQGTAEAKTKAFHLTLAPKVDYLFLPDSKFRPFVGGAIGLVSTSQRLPQYDADTSLTGLGLLGRVGGRWFVTPGLSVDPALNFSWQTLSGSTDVGALNLDSTASGYTIGLSVCLSGWVR